MLSPTNSIIVLCLQALQGTKLNSKPLKIVIHEALSKERRAELAAANSAKSRQQQPRQTADGETAAAGGDGSADSSSSGSRKAGRKQQQKPRLTYSLKVTNMSWSTDAEGLSKHFADCPVSCRLAQVSVGVLAWVRSTQRLRQQSTCVLHWLCRVCCSLGSQHGRPSITA